MRRFATIVALIFALGLASWPVALAQEEAASPTPVTCEAPTLPPGTPDPNRFGQPPVPGADLTPPAGGVPADEATAAEVIAAVHNLIACYNAGNAEGYAALHSPRTERYIVADMVRAGQWGPPTFEVRSAGNVLVYPDGRYSVEAITKTIFNLMRDRLFFVREGGWLLLDSYEAHFAPVEVTEPHETVTVTFMDDHRIVVDPPVVPHAEIVVIRGVDATTNQIGHGALLAEFPSDLTVEMFIAGEVNIGAAFDPFPDYRGDLTLPPRPEGAEMVLHEPPAGVVTIICVNMDEDGVEHYRKGEVAQFTLQ